MTFSFQNSSHSGILTVPDTHLVQVDDRDAKIDGVRLKLVLEGRDGGYDQHH